MRENDGSSRGEKEQPQTSINIDEQTVLESAVHTFSRTRATIPFRIVPLDYE